MKNSALPFRNLQCAVSAADLPRYADGWLLTCDIERHSEQTLKLRRIILDKLLWFLREKCLDACGLHELRLFFSYLNHGHEQVNFYTADCSRICSQEIFPFSPSERVSFSRSQGICLDWAGQNVCIETEYGMGTNGRLSIHEFLKAHLNIEGNDVVFYDHRSGEIADFVCLSLRGETVSISLYHCKSSGGANASERVGDVYEVIGQAIKSLIWIHDNWRLRRQMINRSRDGSLFIKGNRELLDEIFEESHNRLSIYEIVAVQPGISLAQISNRTDRIFGAANDFIISARCEPLKILCSA